MRASCCRPSTTTSPGRRPTSAHMKARGPFHATGLATRSRFSEDAEKKHLHHGGKEDAETTINVEIAEIAEHALGDTDSTRPAGGAGPGARSRGSEDKPDGCATGLSSDPLDLA